VPQTKSPQQVMTNGLGPIAPDRSRRLHPHPSLRCRRPVLSSTPRILISGFGLVTPLGSSATATFRALLEGRTIADRAAKVAADAGPVALAQAAGGVPRAVHTAGDPAVDLAEMAARDALHGCVDGDESLTGYLGTSKGAMYALTAAAESV